MAKEIKINAFEAYENTRMPKSSKVVTYELIDIKPDPDNKGLFLGSWHYVRPWDIIEHEGKFHDIGIVERYNPDGSYVLRNDVSFPPNERFRLNLSPGNPIHEEIYRFLEWCNENESNPNRRTDVVPVFRKVNAAAIAKSEVEKEKALFEAQSLFFAMKDDELRNVANLLGVPSQDEIDVVKSNLLVKVKNTTDQFLKVAKKGTSEIDDLVIIKDAIKQGLLKVDKGLKTVSFGDDDRLVFEYFGAKVKEEDLLKSLQEKHSDVIDAIKAQLS